jgi:uncharacterized protein
MFDWHISIYLVAPLLGWLLAHLIKLVIRIARPDGRRVRIADIFSSGGMPSAHSAITMATAGVIGGKLGLDSALFALSLVVVAIVAYDACNVRRSVGEQAEVLAVLLKQSKLEIKFRKVRGHTFTEVIAGLALGLVVAFVLLQIL